MTFTINLDLIKTNSWIIKNRQYLTNFVCFVLEKKEVKTKKIELYAWHIWINKLQTVNTKPL